MPAFSQIARAQMRDPLGSSTGGMLTELQALEDLLVAAAPAAIQDATAVGAILDLGGGSEWQCHHCQRRRRLNVGADGR